MAKKKTILRDSFEHFAELGKTTAKRTAKTVKSIALDVGTQKALEQLVDARPTKNSEKINGKNHTPLDLDKLKNNYAEQDKQKESALKAHLFQLSRQAEEQVVVNIKQERQKKEQQALQEEQEKKRTEGERKRQSEEGVPLPSGKKRRSIFSPRKKAQEQHMETRPSSGKQ